MSSKNSYAKILKTTNGLIGQFAVGGFMGFILTYVLPEIFKLKLSPYIVLSVVVGTGLLCCGSKGVELWLDDSSNHNDNNQDEHHVSIPINDANETSQSDEENNETQSLLGHSNYKRN